MSTIEHSEALAGWNAANARVAKLEVEVARLRGLIEAHNARCANQTDRYGQDYPEWRVELEPET